MSASRHLRGPAGLGAAFAVVVLALAGCTTPTAGPSPRSTVTVTAPPSPSAPNPSTSAPTSAPAGPSTSSASSSPSTRKDPDAPAHQCPNADLAVTVRQDENGNGLSHRGFFIAFQNTGATRCELRGAPGVSLVGGGDGTQLGAAAQRTEVTSPPTVEIAPRGYAVAILDSEEMDSHGGIFADGRGGDPKCKVTEADGYRIYPPHSYRAIFVKQTGLYACTTQVHWQSIGEVNPADRVDGFNP